MHEFDDLWTKEARNRATQRVHEEWNDARSAPRSKRTGNASWGNPSWEQTSRTTKKRTVGRARSAGNNGVDSGQGYPTITHRDGTPWSNWQCVMIG